MKQRIKQLKELSNVAPVGLISASTNFSEGRTEENGELDHYIGATTTKHCPNHLSQLEVPASTWAVFEARIISGCTAGSMGRIYSEWFPSSHYEQIEGPEILWNEHKDVTSPSFKSEIWIPISKK
ncbi:GyrI-like domain-containing protein [Bacillus velezensis]|nr:GyrI-like domain-containing protein [Bacillus velezensis]